MRLAPPCSTSSQARSIPLAGRRGPEPLRSWQRPDGLATLGFAGRCHVNAANKLYCRTASLLQACVHASVYFSVENPAGSHFWNTSFMRGFFKANHAAIQFVQFDHYCSGGTRRKTIALWRNLSALSNFGVLCRPDLNHVHDEWGIASKVPLKLLKRLLTLLAYAFSARIAAVFRPFRKVTQGVAGSDSARHGRAQVRLWGSSPRSLICPLTLMLFRAAFGFS